MPRLNIYLPEHLLPKWRNIPNKSKWIQEQLEKK